MATLVDLQEDLDNARRGYDEIAAQSGLQCPASEPYPYLTGTRCCADIVIDKTGVSCVGNSIKCADPPCVTRKGTGSDCYKECTTDECRSSCLWKAAAIKTAGFVDHIAQLNKSAASISVAGNALNASLKRADSDKSISQDVVDRGTQLLLEAAKELRSIAEPGVAAEKQTNEAEKLYRDARLRLRSIMMQTMGWIVAGVLALGLSLMFVYGSASSGAVTAAIILVAAMVLKMGAARAGVWRSGLVQGVG